MASAPPRRRSIFRPCIDLHDGQVKQIVGGTLSDTTPDTLKLISQSAGDFARIYKDRGLEGGHIIKLGGGGNDAAAKEALQVWPGTSQIGGGVNVENAKEWLDAGAGKFSLERLQATASVVGKERLVVDMRDT
ncbi:hypothetical protein K443DRAFT_680063 [Laccaria amethystina LaAM-08-1]|uniref:Uncharacterized protein n=1 Tax=Laccaria amethystina LaAM-08-1 TaxID=1095629 RepID=A0A0C9XCP0_9AGAR|nr:hypothetical protein K443DRAFT_680063 [Laccaria amethystina LaAM-08-1]